MKPASRTTGSSSLSAARRRKSFSAPARPPSAPAHPGRPAAGPWPLGAGALEQADDGVLRWRRVDEVVDLPGLAAAAPPGADEAAQALAPHADPGAAPAREGEELVQHQPQRPLRLRRADALARPGLVAVAASLVGDQGEEVGGQDGPRFFRHRLLDRAAP